MYVIRCLITLNSIEYKKTWSFLLEMNHYHYPIAFNDITVFSKCPLSR